jgi:hypothetical protein
MNQIGEEKIALCPICAFNCVYRQDVAMYFITCLNCGYRCIFCLDKTTAIKQHNMFCDIVDIGDRAKAFVEKPPSPDFLIMPKESLNTRMLGYIGDIAI